MHHLSMKIVCSLCGRAEGCTAGVIQPYNPCMQQSSQAMHYLPAYGAMIGTSMTTFKGTFYAGEEAGISSSCKECQARHTLGLHSASATWKYQHHCCSPGSSWYVIRNICKLPVAHSSQLQMYRLPAVQWGTKQRCLSAGHVEQTTRKRQRHDSATRPATPREMSMDLIDLCNTRVFGNRCFRPEQKNIVRAALQVWPNTMALQCCFFDGNGWHLVASCTLCMAVPHLLCSQTSHLCSVLCSSCLPHLIHSFTASTWCASSSSHNSDIVVTQCGPSRFAELTWRRAVIC